MQLSLSAKIYIGLISVLTLFAVAYFTPRILWLSQDLTIAQAISIFAVLGFLTQIYEVELIYGRRTSTMAAINMAVILLGGIPLAIAVTLLATLMAEIILRWGKLATGFMNFAYRVCFNTGQLVLSTLIGALTFDLLGGRPFLLNNDLIQDDLVFLNQMTSAGGAFAAHIITNTSLVSGILTLFEKTAFTYHLWFSLRHFLLQVLSLGILGILLARIYALSPWNLLVILIPLGLVHISLRNYMKLRHQAQKTFERVAQLLSDRDPYTYEHSSEVADLAEKIARKLKLPQEQIEHVRSAAAIHDIGKLGVPDRILHKPGPLTDEEWVIMKKHPDIGANLLKDLEIDAYIIDIVRHEHERWDGSGYPGGLKGERIPMGARIVAVADVYNALTTDRPYRPAYSHEEALRILQKMRGTELDPQVVDALFSVLEDTSTLLATHTLIRAEAH